jgi:hypothetical protein
MFSDSSPAENRHRNRKQLQSRVNRPARLRSRISSVEQLENRLMLSLLGQQLYPSDYPWNQNISNAPVAANSAAIIAHIGASVPIHPDWGADSSSNGTDPLYGIPFNVVHGNSAAKVNVTIDNYPGESDITPVPIPANAVIEGDYQNGPNPKGGGYNSGQRGDSHLIVWDEDNNIAYELYGVTRPADPTLFPNTSGNELPHTDGLWHAAQETVWNMDTDNFRTLGETSADAAGLSILAGLARPDEGLPTSQGGQGAIDHALRLTLAAGDINPQYIYPASHMVSTSQGSDNLPLGGRLRLANTPAIDTLISNMPPESQIVARAMQQYGLIVADIGSSMYVTGSSASVDASNDISLTWNLNDIFASNGLETLDAGDFQVINLTPVVTGLGTPSGGAASNITITGQNFSGAAGHISVYFGAAPASSVSVLSDTEITAVVPSGTGTVDVTVQSGVNETDNLSDNPDANVNAPIFGYGTSATSAADKFTYTAFTPVSISGQVFSDLNGDGLQQAGEPGLAGWTINLFSGSTVVNSAITNSTGNYSITGVGAGTYSLKEVTQNDYFQTDPSAGAYNFTASSGVNISGENFGDFLVASVSGSTLTVNLDSSAPLAIGSSGSNTVVTLGNDSFPFSGITGIIISSRIGGVLNFNGPLTIPIAFAGDSGADVVDVNSGTLNLASSAAISLQTLTIGSNSAAVMTSASSIQSELVLGGLAIASTGKLDIADNEVLLNYASSDPISSVAKWIVSGYAAGAWNGFGIMSTNAQINSKNYGIGYADSADPKNPAGLASAQIEIKYTLLGDANLDGKVDGTDFGILAANFGHSVTAGWDEGDFNYDGKVNGSDFALLATNFGQSSGVASIEPSTLADSIVLGMKKVRGRNVM